MTLVVDQHVSVHLVRQPVDVRWILVRRLKRELCLFMFLFYFFALSNAKKSSIFILTAPWYISTSFSPKYGICLKGLTDTSTGPMHVY